MHQWGCKQGASSPDVLVRELTPYPLSPSPFSLQSHLLHLSRVWLHNNIALTMSKHVTLSWPLSSPEGSKAPSYEQDKETKPAPHGSISEFQVSSGSPRTPSNLMCSTPWILKPMAVWKRPSFLLKKDERMEPRIPCFAHSKGPHPETS